MNMQNDPSKNQLRALLYACNDLAGCHILWVNRLGEVHITLLGKETPAHWAERMESQIQFRYAVYEAGNDYVGPNVAINTEYVSLLFNKLLQDWHGRKQGLVD